MQTLKDLESAHKIALTPEGTVYQEPRNDQVAEVQEYVNLWTAVLEQCVKDIKEYRRLVARNGEDYKGRIKRNYKSAVRFLKSDAMDLYCEICQVDPDRFRSLALAL